jgi:uncharacterized RDD family membrane protein YckC
MTVWYYSTDGVTSQSASWEQLQQLAAQGILRPNDLVWRAGLKDWVQAEAIKGLFPHPSAAMRGAQGVGPIAPVTPVLPTTNPYAAPTPGYAAVIQRIHYAGFWRRFAAVFIDGIIAGLIIGFFRVFIGFLLANQDPTLTEVDIDIIDIVLRLFDIVVGWLYYAIMESSPLQGTLGKLALSIKVTDLEGRRISFLRATGRHFAKFVSACILYIGFLMAGFTEKKQALHDMIAGTLVVCR